MEAYIVEWLNLLGRWVHMITGIAWIGASFYFIWLDNHLREPKNLQDASKGVAGELWAVHGGGFYHAQKYKVAPETLPETLHWFKWEAYSTWFSGIFLLALMYWYGAEIYLIDPQVAALTKPAAIAIGIATIPVGWIVYDTLCRCPLGKNNTWLGIVLFVLLSATAWGLCQLFSGRGAYIHYGAILGTIMVANVVFVIIPGQKDLVRAKNENREPDPVHGIRGKQRSVHNTYFTLPVLFIMISNHYAMTYGHTFNWLILIGFTIAGALVRVFFVGRHFGKTPWLPLIVAIAVIAAIVVALAPKRTQTTMMNNQASSTSKEGKQALFDQVVTIVTTRCTSCHATQPSQPGFAAPPKGVVFSSPEDITRQSQTIHQQTVVTKAMPIGNLTGITDEERLVIDTWFNAGTRTN